MRISAIQNYQRNNNFLGEKKNKLKNIAGATAIAIAASAPVSADAQFYYYTPTVPLNPTAKINAPGTIPDCFILGDLKTYNEQKTMRQVFDEIDENESGTLSVNEVIKKDRENKLRYNAVYNQYQLQRTKNQFQILSEAYNEEDSNPNTINFNEYKSIMEDYLDTEQIKLINSPGIIYPLPPLYYNPFIFDRPHHHPKHRDHNRPPEHHRR